jgi:predicted  nucleic acid-binding Zn-ribbon protein
MSQSLHLFSLQKADLQIDKINSRLSEIEKILQSDRKVMVAQKKLDEINDKNKNARITLGLIEDEVKTNKIKQETNEASLYGGRIHNPKELQDLQKDIETRKKNIQQLEEKQLDAMIFLEEAEKEKLLGEDNLRQVQALVVEQKATLAGERDILLKNKANIESERGAILGNITNDNLLVYQKLRQQKKGIAVSSIEEDSCSSCGSDLRPEELQMVRSSNQLYYCVSCGRILTIG